jgi:hypothetical protein
MQQSSQSDLHHPQISETCHYTISCNGISPSVIDAILENLHQLLEDATPGIAKIIMTLSWSTQNMNETM